jgi:putative transcriptional regulator
MMTMRGSKFSRDLLQGMEEAADFVEGRQHAGMRVHLVDVPDVKGIRHELRMSQSVFAAAFHIPVSTLKNWEQGRRAPDAPAAAYLKVISRQPTVVQEAHRMAASGTRRGATGSSRKRAAKA